MSCVAPNLKQLVSLTRRRAKSYSLVLILQGDGAHSLQFSGFVFKLLEQVGGFLFSERLVRPSVLWTAQSYLTTSSSK